MPVSMWTTPQLVVMLEMLYRELSQRLSVNIGPISAEWQWDSRQWDDATVDGNMTFNTVAEMLSLQESPESEVGACFWNRKRRHCFSIMGSFHPQIPRGLFGF